MEGDKPIPKVAFNNNSSIDDDFDRKYLALKRGNNITIFPRSNIDRSNGISTSLSSRNILNKNNPK